MRLAAKLVLLYLIGLLLIVAVFTGLTLRNEKQLVAMEHQRQAANLVASMQSKIRDAYRTGDQNALRRVLQQTTTQSSRRMQIRIIERGTIATGEGPPGVPVDLLVTRREVTTISIPEPDGQDRLYTYVPMDPTTTGEPGAIEVSSLDESSGDRLQRSLWQSAIALVGVSVLSGCVILVGGVWMVGRPLDQLIEKVRRVGDGHFDQPVQISQRDELGKLGLAINQMCGQLEMQREKIEEETAARLATVGQLRHADRLTTLGRLAAGVAHEVGTPLNVVSGRAELIASGELSEHETRRSASAIKHESDRIAKIIRSLLDFARRGSPQRQATDLCDVIDQVATLMQPLAEKSSVEIAWTRPADPVVAEVDAGQIQQVITNLVVNAIAAMPHGGTLAIETETGRNSGSVILKVADQGHGIAPEHLDSIFEPFFTTKDVGEGTGLGLSIAHGIVEDHEGSIKVQSALGEGTQFQIHLPIHADQKVSADQSESTP